MNEILNKQFERSVNFYTNLLNSFLEDDICFYSMKNKTFDETEIT